MQNKAGEQVRLHLSIDEIQIVSQFFLGQPVIKAHAYNRGSARFPKAIIETADGARFLIKRRKGSSENISRVTLSHEVQFKLTGHNFPVAALQKSKNDASWDLNSGCIYEMFTFIEGDRYQRSAWEARESGKLLSRMHRMLQAWKPSVATPNHVGYHASQSVFLAWDRLVPKILAVDPKASERKLQRIVEILRTQYNDAGVIAESALQSSAEQGNRSILHGDFHPGNILFRAGNPIAMLDFDSARLDWTIFDIANASLQFSIPSMGQKPVSHWDATLNTQLIESFLDGYAWSGEILLNKDECSALSALMIEATIAETIPRIALSGIWEGRSGIDVLRFIALRAEWIGSQKEALAKLCQSCMQIES
ncbi:MAG: phosphotransferase [Planctomycetota bacterium]|nr:phosphotransferase [Planctomycetota bacterium]